MVSNDRKRAANDDEMETEEGDEGPYWTSDRFMELRKEYLESDRSEQTAVGFIARMCSIVPSDVHENSWLDCKDVISLFLSGTKPYTMLVTHQAMFLEAVRSCPAHVVNTLAQKYADTNSRSVYSDVDELLVNAALPVTKAFIERLEEETATEITALVAPVADARAVGEALNAAMNKPGTGASHRMRIFQILATSYTFRPSTGESDIRHCLLVQLQKELMNEKDVLAQLAALDLLTDIAITHHENAREIERVGTVSKVYEIMKECKANPDGGFMYPATIKFFGCLAHCYPETISSYPLIVPEIMDKVHHFDLLDAQQRVLAFDSLAHLAFTKEGKVLLTQSTGEESMTRALRSLGASIASGPVELRTSHIHAMSVLFENGDESLSKWFADLGAPLPGILLTLAKKPFPELRNAVYSVLMSVCKYKFGVRSFITLEGFRSWLAEPENEWTLHLDKKKLIGLLLNSDIVVQDPTLQDELTAAMRRISLNNQGNPDPQTIYATMN